MKCLYCLNCPRFGQLIIKKIIRIVATRCQIFGGGGKNVQNSISLRPPSGEEGRYKRRRKGGSKKSLAPNLHHGSTPLQYSKEITDMQRFAVWSVASSLSLSLSHSRSKIMGCLSEK